MLARSSGLSRLTRLTRLKPSIRQNSSHHHANAHHAPIQGDGTVRICLIQAMLTTALMTPGVAKSFAFAGVLYVIYLMDRSVAARNNGVGLLTRLCGSILDEGMSNEELYAMMEASRETTMEHYELKQKPIQRVIYPEYGHLEYVDTNA
jgi:hypothetical protein